MAFIDTPYFLISLEIFLVSFFPSRSSYRYIFSCFFDDRFSFTPFPISYFNFGVFLPLPHLEEEGTGKTFHLSIAIGIGGGGGFSFLRGSFS